MTERPFERLSRVRASGTRGHRRCSRATRPVQARARRRACSELDDRLAREARRSRRAERCRSTNVRTNSRSIRACSSAARSPRARRVSIASLEDRLGAGMSPPLIRAYPISVRSAGSAGSSSGNRTRGALEQRDRRRNVAAVERLLRGPPQQPPGLRAELGPWRSRARGSAGTPARGGSRRARPSPSPASSSSAIARWRPARGRLRHRVVDDLADQRMLEAEALVRRRWCPGGRAPAGRGRTDAPGRARARRAR